MAPFSLLNRILHNETENLHNFVDYDRFYKIMTQKNTSFWWFLFNDEKEAIIPTI